MQILIRVLERVMDAIGTFCGFLMILMTINVLYNVVMRYVFNDVSIGMQELEWHLFSAMFMLGIAYTLKEDGHVRVDVIYSNLSKKSQSIINIFGVLIFVLPVTFVIIYFSVGYTLDAYDMMEGSPDPGGLPYRWIVRSVIPISSLFLVMSSVYSILVQIQIISEQKNLGKLS